MSSALRLVAVFFLAIAGIPIAAFAAPVSHLSATQVAQNFMRSHVALHGSWNGVTDPRVASMELVSHAGEPLLYNVRVEPSGFMLVAYDDDFSPVLMYSDTSSFDAGKVADPESVAAWIIPETYAVRLDMQKRAAQIGSAELVAAVKADAPSTHAWAHFNRSPSEFQPLPLALKADGPADGTKMLKAGPLLTSAWGQGNPTHAPYTYNLYTPGVTGANGCTHVYTGCVATAAAQLMRYHAWPDNGVGSHSYQIGGTTLNANFAHAYNWSSMPDRLGASSSATQIDAVARLMSDVGVANDMKYGCGGSSSTFERLTQIVLPTYFKYRSGVQIVERSAYTASTFFNALRAEIDATPPRPLFFRIYALSGGGHAVVVDGYQLGATNMVHVNLGWEDGYNLYYDISNNWTTGSSTWEATSQAAFTNIQPDRPTSCAYALSGSTLSAGAGAGSGAVNVSTASACAWNATSNASFVTVTSGASGSGNGTVGFTIAANSGAARTGTLTIGGQTFTVNQAAPSCSYSISPSSQSISAAAGSGNVNVTAGGGCAWSAYSNASWIAITSGASGTGNGSVVYSVAGNGSLTARSGTIVAAGQSFTVNQAAESCSYSVTPSSASVGSAATTGRLNVGALGGCAWTAQSNAAWLTVTSGASGNGEGSVSYSVAANTTSSSRTGSITVGGKALTVTQAGQDALGAGLLNGDFESGRSGWTEQSDYILIYENFLYAYEGSWYAWLAGYDSADDTLHQRVTIPANATQVTLDFWYGITTDEVPTGAYDKMFVNVYNGSTGTVIATLGQFSNLDAGPIWKNRTYDLSAYKGQTIYVGFHATSDSSLDTNFYLDNVKITAGGGGGSANYTALYWNANESGWGLNVNHQSDTIFATLFDYDATGKAMWLVATLQKQGVVNGSDVFAGDLLRTTGPAFNASPFTPIDGTNVTTVGQMALALSGDSGGLSYTVNGVQVTKSITKQAVGPRVATCSTGATTDRSGLTNYQDLWWAGQNESGWGINLTHSGDNIFATLFTYDSAGQGTHNPGLWLVTTATRQSDGSYLGDLLRTTGPAFNASPFTPITGANITTVGTMRFRFTSGSQGTLTYTVNGTTVTKTITRQVFGASPPSCAS